MKNPNSHRQHYNQPRGLTDSLSRRAWQSVVRGNRPVASLAWSVPTCLLTATLSRGDCWRIPFSDIGDSRLIIISSHLSLNREGRWSTTDYFATSFLHFSPLFSTALWALANSRPVHSLMLSSHLFLCLPCLLPPFHCALQDGLGQTR